MRFWLAFKSVGTAGALCVGAAILSSPGFAAESPQLEAVETDVNDSADALEPVYIDGETVDVEFFGRPAPESEVDVIEDSIDEPYEDTGVEVIRLSVPAE